MADLLNGNTEQVIEKIRTHGLRYGVSIGRRAPMHLMHRECLLEIEEAGLKSIIVVGSVNGAESRFFNPLCNPLTIEQQQRQLAIVVPDIYARARILLLPDKGDPELWLAALSEQVSQITEIKNTVLHFRTKKEVASSSPKHGIHPLTWYAEACVKRGFTVWQSSNSDPADDAINASALRMMNLEELTPEQKRLFAAPDYIYNIAAEARAKNPDKALLKGLPITMLDLTLARLHREAGEPSAHIIDKAGPGCSLNEVKEATKSAIIQLQSKIGLS